MDIARSVLEQAGHVVDVVSDGADAIKAVQKTDYDLILMERPGTRHGQHGREPAHPRARAADEQDAIIAMTANVLPQQLAAFQDAGMGDHVGKQDELARSSMCAGGARDLRRKVADQVRPPELH